METPGNIYDTSRRYVFERFGKRLHGAEAGLVLVVYTEEPDGRAHDALEKSFDALGYGPEPCTFAQVEGLDAKDVFALVEGIDPLCLVAADDAAATLCGHAVRREFPPMRRLRLFGRDARAFSQLNTQLETEQGRQAVWHLLKTLPRA